MQHLVPLEGKSPHPHQPSSPQSQEFRMQLLPEEVYEAARGINAINLFSYNRQFHNSKKALNQMTDANLITALPMIILHDSEVVVTR